MKKIVTVLFLSGLFLSCAHHRDVRPGADGLHRVALNSNDADQAERDAILQATHFCEQRGLSPGFVDESKNYTGDMSESDYIATRRAGTVAKTVGGTVSVLGGRNESKLGSIVGLGGVAAHAAAGKGYTVEMTFKCI